MKPEERSREFVNEIRRVNLRLALEHLVDAIRWRRDSHNSDGEDLEPSEHEAFDRAEAALAATQIAALEQAVVDRAKMWRFDKTHKADVELVRAVDALLLAARESDAEVKR